MPAVSGLSGVSSSGSVSPAPNSRHTHALSRLLLRCSREGVLHMLVCLLTESTWLRMLSKHGHPRMTSHSSQSIDRIATAADSCVGHGAASPCPSCTQSISHQPKEAPLELGGNPQSLSQGCRGSRVWGSLLLLLTCCPFFSGFLVDLIGGPTK